MLKVSAKHTMRSMHSAKFSLDRIDLMEKIVFLLDQFEDQLQYSDSNVHQLYDNVNIISQYLKNFGSTLDKLYKDQLDRAFVQFRTYSLRAESDDVVKLYLSELIELRANQWSLNESSSNYYRKKIQDLMEKIEGFLDNDKVAMESNDVAISTFRFAKPSRTHSKNYYKDELVIRNVDSGKVMGVKGKRVHTIEELSGTIISFQRVQANAKERLVQITGPEESNIFLAKQLIEETIKRNASPVPEFEKAEHSFYIDEDYEDDNANFAKNDLNNFKYTIRFCDNFVRITGDNLDLINECMEVLEGHFATKRSGYESHMTIESENNGVSLIQTQTNTENKTETNKLRYNLKNLLMLRTQPQCLQKPNGFKNISADLSVLLKDPCV